jgi:hypothetical protein
MLNCTIVLGYVKLQLPSPPSFHVLKFIRIPSGVVRQLFRWFDWLVNWSFMVTWSGCGECQELYSDWWEGYLDIRTSTDIEFKVGSSRQGEK